MKNTNDTDKLQKKLGYRFKKQSLLDNALRHSSYVNEQSDTDLGDNERLEFLGDAVLNLVVGHMLMSFYPDLHEGDLSRMRANLVNESRLAKIARSINLGHFILLGKGELQTLGRQKSSILSDAFEALIAAVYLDSGFDSAFSIIETHFASLLRSASRSIQTHDAKSQLQELVQGTYKFIPHYKVIDESGPDHDKTFKVRLKVRDLHTEGVGKSKKAAEQEAARKALEILKKA